MKERLQKILSARGICSRRKAEEFIKDGLVKINGKVAKLGQKADPDVDIIKVDGKAIESRKDLLYYLMNKPVGIVTENVARSNTVRDLLPKKLQGKIFPVGRLDKNTSGLLLFTNDGALAYRLIHPKFYHEKEYEVRVEKPITDGMLKKLESGLKILGKKTKPAKIKRLSGRRFTITLTEGRNRQIRRMCQKVGAPVKELRRVRIVTVRDAKLKDGRVCELSEKEKRGLLKSVELQ